MSINKGIKESTSEAILLAICNKAIEKLCDMDKHTLSEAIVKAERLQFDNSAQILNITLNQDKYVMLDKMAVKYNTTKEALLSMLITLFVNATKE